ncbi:hypothetical protein LDK93_02730 [Staphylococcus pasteuri]|uniref:Uncharacterized protein n=1 Tax=uncultured Caudovirales phage TaxID=2100421 RepID=A0A2H4J2M0_9CAUD|nr:hypothetical protein [Staphylococcus pasteuri]ASN69342.1 hypothetical protein 10S14_20 [uncultured Caudovirales phage]MCD9065974.1 hypothetical protein [Staphylococcus pasteuri]
MEQQDKQEVSYYLPRHEYIERESKLYRYIDQGDKNVENQLEQVNLNLQTFIESQKPFHQTLKDLLDETKAMNSNMTKQTRRTEKLEDEQVRIKESINAIQEGLKQKISDRNKLILGIVTAFAGGGGLMPVLAQIFFK